MTQPYRASCDALHDLCGRLALGRHSDTIAVMEICGTHTMSIARSGLRQLLPDRLRLISGPGCPVCVTDQSYVDQAVALARGEFTGHRPGPIVTTYGDMLRVGGRCGSLADAQAEGADVRVVYSAQQALEIARANPAREVVFLAVGFETTAPAAALAVQAACQQAVSNFSIMSAHKRLLPAMNALLKSGSVSVDGFLCPGHVSVMLGWRAYESIVADYHRPCVVAGFDPPQVLAALVEILRQIVDDSPSACSVYPAVKGEGNTVAMRLLEAVFEPCNERWRALGEIPHSGYALRGRLREFEASVRFDMPPGQSYEMPGCRCGEVICGRLAPSECEMFGQMCTPREPMGPCMVSSEGACAAAYKYERCGLLA